MLSKLENSILQTLNKLIWNFQSNIEYLILKKFLQIRQTQTLRETHILQIVKSHHSIRRIAPVAPESMPLTYMPCGRAIWRAHVHMWLATFPAALACDSARLVQPAEFSILLRFFIFILFTFEFIKFHKAFMSTN